MQQINIDIFFFVRSIKKNLKLFYLLNSLIIIGSIAVSFVLPVYYESKIVFYPYSPEASDPRSFFGEKLKFNVFSDVDQSEKFILMSKSKIVKMAVIQKYNLINRYNLNASDPDVEYKVLEAFTENMKIKKEENGGIIISAFDKNRDTAALIANEIVYQVEQLSLNNIREKNAKVLEVLKSNYLKMDDYVKTLREQAKENEAKKQSVDKELEFALQEYTNLKFKYEQTGALVGNDMKSILIIEPASASFRKARPFRSLIVGGALIVSLIITTFGIGAKEFFKEV